MENLSQTLNQLLFRPEFALPFFVWLGFWKGLALWKAARKKHLSWFVILLLVNSLGLLEIAYVFYLYRFDLYSTQLLAFLEKKFKTLKKS